MKPLCIAVSGSTGLIGSAVCARLLREGHTIRPLLRAQSGSRFHASLSSPILWDPLQGLDDPTQLEQVDCVYHLAGRSIASRRWSASEKQRIRDSRVRATCNLVSQICQLDAPPKIFISASAIGIYGDRGSEVIDESSSNAHDFLAGVASDWEDACQPLVQRGIRVVHPRLGIVLSRSGGALAQMLPIFQWMLGGRLASGQQFWSWISLEDTVSALHWMMEQSIASGPYNLVAPQQLTNADFTKLIARHLGVPAVIPVPAWALRLAMGEMADALLLSSCRVVPARLLEAGFQFKYPQLKAFLEAELVRR